MDITKLSDEQLEQLMKKKQAEQATQDRLRNMSNEELNSLYKKSMGDESEPFVSGFEDKSVGQYITGAIPDVFSMLGGTAGALLTRSPTGGAMGASLGYGKGKVIQNYLEGAPIADKELFLGMVQEAALDVSGAKAAQIFGDAYRSISNSGVISALNPLKPSEINQFYAKQKLQEKLAKRGSGLSLNQVVPESGFIQAMAGAAEAAVSPSKVLKQLEEGQISYLNSEISKLKKVGSGMKGKQLGVAVQGIIENTREAAEKYHDKLFMDLAEVGKTTAVDLSGAKAYVKAVKKKALEGVKTSVKESPNIPFKDRTKASASTETKGTSKQSRWLDPKVGEFVSLINQLDTKQNFNVAYDKLKIIKKKVAQLKATPENKPILRDLVKIEKAFESAIVNSASDPKIAEMYKGLMKSYSSTMDVTFSKVAQRLFDEDAPEVVAKMLFADNRAMNNMDEFKRIVELGKKHKVKGGTPVLGALRKGWLIHTMKGTKDPDKAMQRLRTALEDPDKSEVYEYLMDDSTKKKVRILLNEFDILSQRANKELSLVVRGEQTAGGRQAVQGAGVTGKFMGAVRAILPAKLPNVLAGQTRINDLLKISDVAKKLDSLSAKSTLTRAEKEMKGRLSAHFVSLQRGLMETTQELRNDYFENEYMPQLESARNMLFGAAQSENAIGTVPQ